MDQFESKEPGGQKMSENQSTDHVELMRLLQAAKPLMEPLFPDQKKKWAADSPLAQQISNILKKHPEYYEEIRAHVGDIFAKPNS
jgi:hypothetical protein